MAQINHISLEEAREISKDLNEISVQMKELKDRALKDMERMVVPFSASTAQELLDRARCLSEDIDRYSAFLDNYSSYINQSCNAFELPEMTIANVCNAFK